MADWVEMLRVIILDKRAHFLLAAIKGFRNGLVYGFRIRFPHALATTLVFGSGSLMEKLITVQRLTVQHSLSLAKFVFMYKVLTGVPIPLLDRQSFVAARRFCAAALCSYINFGQLNAVNLQIALYLLSRAILSFGRLVGTRLTSTMQKPNNWSLARVFPLLSMFSWAMCFHLTAEYPTANQQSLVSSYQYIYKDSDRWSCWTDWLIYNRL